jgi:SHAQKYF class myb-like DNA-binding protein
MVLTFSAYAEAVAKRILELMNVEKLTRENIASTKRQGTLCTYL